MRGEEKEDDEDDAVVKLEGTAVELVLKQDPSGRVDAFLSVRILGPSRQEISALTRLVGVPRGTAVEDALEKRKASKL